jgi:hypothetical protein
MALTWNEVKTRLAERNRAFTVVLDSVDKITADKLAKDAQIKPPPHCPLLIEPLLADISTPRSLP